MPDHSVKFVIKKNKLTRLNFPTQTILIRKLRGGIMYKYLVEKCFF